MTHSSGAMSIDQCTLGLWIEKKPHKIPLISHFKTQPLVNHAFDLMGMWWNVWIFPCLLECNCKGNHPISQCTKFSNKSKGGSEKQLMHGEVTTSNNALLWKGTNPQQTQLQVNFGHTHLSKKARISSWGIWWNQEILSYSRFSHCFSIEYQEHRESFSWNNLNYLLINLL